MESLARNEAPPDFGTSETAGEEYLSVAQVAKRLGCSVSLVQKWRRMGWLPATRLGPPDVPVYGYRLEDVERFALERWNRRRGRPPAHPAGEEDETPETDVVPMAASPRAAPAAMESRATTGRNDDPTAAPVEPEMALATPAVAPARAGMGLERIVLEPLRTTSEQSRPAASGAPATGPAHEDPAWTLVTGQPLVLWAGDPRERTPLVLARFPARGLAAALQVGTLWSRRYDQLALGERAPAGAPVHVVALWQRGQRIAV